MSFCCDKNWRRQKNGIYLSPISDAFDALCILTSLITSLYTLYNMLIVSYVVRHGSQVFNGCVRLIGLISLISLLREVNIFRCRKDCLNLPDSFVSAF